MKLFESKENMVKNLIAQCNFNSLFETENGRCRIYLGKNGHYNLCYFHELPKDQQKNGNQGTTYNIPNFFNNYLPKYFDEIEDEKWQNFLNAYQSDRKKAIKILIVDMLKCCKNLDVNPEDLDKQLPGAALATDFYFHY